MKKETKTNRRDFFKFGLLAGSALLAGKTRAENLSDKATENGEKIKMLTPDGKLVEVYQSQIERVVNKEKLSDEEVWNWMKR